MYFDGQALQKRLEFADQCNIDIACWSQLVSWAFGHTDFEDCFNQGCRPEFAPYAYCGKCDKYFDGTEHKKFPLLVAVI